MKMARLFFAAFVILPSAAIFAADDDSYKVHVYSWSYGRERKTITSSNRVTANFMIKNVSQENLNDVTLTITYMEGLGNKLEKQPPAQKIALLKAGEAKKIQMVGDFIPIFGSYDITVQYNGNKKEEWNSTSDVGQPNPKNGEPIKGIANVVVAGKELTPDRSGKFAGKVRVRNDGTVEAKNLKIVVTFFDAKKKQMGDPVIEKLGNGTLPGGADEQIPFVLSKAPRTYGGYELNVTCDDTSIETQLSGGEFSKSKDVEFAHYKFQRADPKSADLKVAAQVRNGFDIPVDQVKLTLIFMNAKKKELKRYTHEIKGQLKPGEIKPFEFTVPGLQTYDAYEQQVNFNKVDGSGAPVAKNSDTKIEAAKFQNTPNVEVIFTESLTNDDKSVSLAGAMRNGKSGPVKDVVISVTFKRPDGSESTTEKTLSDVVRPGEERNFVMKVPNAAGFASYGFKFKYSEVEPKSAATAKVPPAESTETPETK
ncbi:MAG TPA: hypothetical protein VEK08_14185 [Planctomycetota bacterium]|nr:hypothetical protein [Planctomycetota bacterium]